MWGLILLEVYLHSHCLSALENLALGKPVWEDQHWRGREDWRGNKAVDGRYTDRSAHGGQCVVSDNFARTATWRVDLGGVVSISHIDIYYRTDNHSRPTTLTSRMAGFFLYVSNTTSKEDGHLCFHEIQIFNGTPSEDQRINCSVHGRYVFYYNERLPGVTYPSYYSTYAFYDLCELEVYGCSNIGYYGSKCNSSCPTNCQEMRCDVNTGDCLGCVPGYVGPTCSQVCPDQTYGQSCLFPCGNCSKGETCHHVNGTCLYGCNVGAQGEQCKIECPQGFYGRDCVYNCSENCNVTRRCDRFTGKCEGGCKQGWTGTTCYQKQTQASLSCDNNNICVISIVVSVVIVLTGSVVNYIYCKKNTAARTSHKRYTEESVTESVTPRQTNRPEDNSEPYTELQDVGKPNTYEDLHTYSN
uniref:Neurogenic locus notch homolog protein 2-like n=1 Tax=Crassostrea virginica TaxID=6565 RepID=A0A8B8BLB1_CRAVI|nr:neurogenic locus notch homolog protein 2-like [Crassostrea virginica]